MNSEKREFLKVKLCDLRDNPFRDFALYPIQEDRIVELLDSINETTFWENLLARRNGNLIELAYGHHRKVAAVRAFGDQHEIRIPVRALSDAMMIKIMGRENSEKYKCIPAAIDSTVKAAKIYLESHPEEERIIKESLSDGIQSDIRLRFGAPILARFLGMPLDAVKKSVERLNAIESGVVDNAALQIMPSTRAADNFIAAVKYAGIKRDAQREIAAKVVEGGLYSPEDMIRAVMKLFPKANKQGRAENETRLFKGIHLIDRLSQEMTELCQGISKDDRIFQDHIWAFDRSYAQLENSLIKTKDALTKARSDMISFSEFQRLLKFLYPLTDTKGLFGHQAGIGINKEQKTMVTWGFAGGMVYLLDCVPSQETMVIPRASVHDLMVLNPRKRWNGIEKEGDKYVYHVGTSKLWHSKVDYKFGEIKADFLQHKCFEMGAPLEEALLSLFPYMCRNVFLKNINGLFIGRRAVYSCDNRRLIRKTCAVAPQLSGLYLNSTSAKLFKRYQKDVRAMGVIKGLVIFQAEKFRAFMPVGEEKFPRAERLFQRANDLRGIQVKVTCPTNELLGDLNLSKRHNSIITIALEGTRMRVTIPLHGSGRSIVEYDISPAIKKKVECRADGRLFIESLLFHRNMKIGRDWILFHNDDQSSSCLLALMDMNNLQLVLFENEEYLTPRELKDRYGLRLRPGLYDLHRLDKIPRMLKRGDIRYMKGSAPPERFSISLAHP